MEIPGNNLLLSKIGITGKNHHLTDEHKSTKLHLKRQCVYYLYHNFLSSFKLAEPTTKFVTAYCLVKEIHLVRFHTISSRSISYYFITFGFIPFHHVRLHIISSCSISYHFIMFDFIPFHHVRFRISKLVNGSSCNEI